MIREGLNLNEDAFMKKKDECIFLLNNSLCYNSFDYLKDLYLTPLDLLSGVHKRSVHGSYLDLSMVGAIISVNKHLTMVQP